MHIQHLTLKVKNLETSIRFYEAITKIKVQRRFKHGEAELAFLSDGPGETELELLQMPGAKTFSGEGLFLCFRTEILEEQHALAVDMGLNPSPIQKPGDGTYYFYVYDPDGFSVQLRSFPETY